MAQASRVPKLVAGVGDLRSLPLTPADGFILTRVNGAASVRDIAAQTGLAEDTVEGSLSKLRSLGIVAFAGETNQPPPPRINTPRAEEAPARPLPRLPDSGGGPLPYDPRELDEACDLTMDDKQRVLLLYYKLDDYDFYQLLSVPHDADKKSIKRSYFELAALFHPDKFFRKNLGAFKQKMEIIFGRVTEAHDTLTSKEKRAEYDQYLEVQAQARGIEAMMAASQAEVQRAQEELRRQAPSSPPLGADARREPDWDGPGGRAPRTSPPPRASSTPDARPRQASSPDLRTPKHPSGTPPAPVDTRELRQALARRLTGAPPRAAALKTPTPVPANPNATFASTQDAMDALKRRYQDRRTEASRAQALKYKSAGDESRAKNDLVAAANAYRVASSFDPEDPELQRLAQVTQEAADHLLAEMYTKQATYEERSGKWPEAARSWARVVRGRAEDPAAHDKLANALVQATGNLHEAADASLRAIALAPAIVAYRITLVNVYLAAGLASRAKRELETALKLEPQNPALKALTKRVEKEKSA